MWMNVVMGVDNGVDNTVDNNVHRRHRTPTYTT